MKNDDTGTAMIATITILFGARPCSKALISQISCNHSAAYGVLTTHQTSFTSAHYSHESPQGMLIPGDGYSIMFILQMRRQAQRD